MIIEYHRPKTMQEALGLLSRSDLAYYPMGGGGGLSQSSGKRIAVVDLQALNLAGINVQGNQVELGATTTLAEIEGSELVQPGLRKALQLEANRNLRNTASVAGALVTGTGKSTFAAAALALDARLMWEPGEVEVGLSEYYALGQTGKKGLLISKVVMAANAQVQLEAVGRSPADIPLVCAAVARWPGGRTRVAVGGQGERPVVVFDGPEAQGAEEAAYNAYSHSILPPFSDLDYIKETLRTLVRRMLADSIPA